MCRDVNNTWQLYIHRSLHEHCNNLLRIFSRPIPSLNEILLEAMVISECWSAFRLSLGMWRTLILIPTTFVQCLPPAKVCVDGFVRWRFTRELLKYVLALAKFFVVLPKYYRYSLYLNDPIWVLIYFCSVILQSWLGTKGGTVVREVASHQCSPRSSPVVDAICGLSLFLVLSFAPRGFSPGSPVFPSPQ